ncbi:MAG: four helix bundle protein [Candidatus Falkowbacteria bacterium]
MNKEELKRRTKQFALRVIKLVNALPSNTTGWAIGKQLIRCGTSVGANYRATCRSRSGVEFIAKIGIVVEEADESVYWLEIIIESGLMKKEFIEPLLKEANEITAIMVASRKSASKNKTANLKS